MTQLEKALTAINGIEQKPEKTHLEKINEEMYIDSNGKTETNVFLRERMLIKTIGKMVKEYRYTNGYSQRQFARKAMVSQSTISQLEQGYVGLSIAIMVLKHIGYELNIKEISK